jgi:hypothetical protein
LIRLMVFEEGLVREVDREETKAKQQVLLI